MEARHLHSWTVTYQEAKQIQADLAAKVSRQRAIEDVKYVAGVDIASRRGEATARASAVVLRYPEMEPVEIKVIQERVSFPYIPGLLSFRESPLIIAACEQLTTEPDLILVDGQGIAHPRRIGLASHLGLLWDRPTIGCAKSRLCGEHGPLGAHAGSYAEIIDGCEVIGAALRTRQDVKPMYVSIGHKLDLPSAVEWVLRCCRGRRQPEPTRLAHLAAGGHLN